jgi:hypothetical protein
MIQHADKWINFFTVERVFPGVPKRLALLIGNKFPPVAVYSREKGTALLRHCGCLRADLSSYVER